jgi:hypothetical protein
VRPSRRSFGRADRNVTAHESSCASKAKSLVQSYVYCFETTTVLAWGGPPMLYVGIPILLITSVCAGVVADSRGRSGIGWFLLNLLLMGVFGLVLVALLPPAAPEPMFVHRPASDPFRFTCPECKEPIEDTARTFCKHCRSSLSG